MKLTCLRGSRAPAESSMREDSNNKSPIAAVTSIGNLGWLVDPYAMELAKTVTGRVRSRCAVLGNFSGYAPGHEVDGVGH